MDMAQAACVLLPESLTAMIVTVACVALWPTDGVGRKTCIVIPTMREIKR